MPERLQYPHGFAALGRDRRELVSHRRRTASRSGDAHLPPGAARTRSCSRCTRGSTLAPLPRAAPRARRLRVHGLTPEI
jgi:hypothetical protein